MDMRTVYRYEDVYGRGPYRGGSWPDDEARYDMGDAHCGSHHPTWGADGLSHVRGSMYLAAFNTREDLDSWFDGWHDALADNGFTVREYTVPADCVEDSISGLQVAFIPM